MQTRFYFIDKIGLVCVMFNILRLSMFAGVDDDGPNAGRDHSEREWVHYD